MRIKEFSWWAFYILFLMIVLFLLSLLVRGLIGGALQKISNAGEVVYFIGLMLAVFGLMAMCIAYVVRMMWRRFKTRQGGET